MQTPVEQMPPAPAQKTNVLSIVSLVTGIIAVLGMCIGIIPFAGLFCSIPGGLCAIAALITGFLGTSQTKQKAEKGRGMAITGIVLGAIALLGICVLIIISLVAGPVIGNVFSQISSGLTNSGY